MKFRNRWTSENETKQVHSAGFTKRGGKLVCTYFEENLLKLLPPAQVEGLYGCLDYYQTVNDPFSVELLNQYNKLYPGSSMLRVGHHNETTPIRPQARAR
jgi:branched-chain amino acid transport system substrate-binding protein